MSSFTYSKKPSRKDAASFTTQPDQPSTLTLTRPAVRRRNNMRILSHGKPPLLLCNKFGYNQRMWHHLTTALLVHH